MFGIGMPELLLILAVALIVIGPKKLPDLAKSLGRAMGEFKRATNDLKQSIEQETGLDDVRESMREVDRDIRRSIDPIDATPVGSASAESESMTADSDSKEPPSDEEIYAAGEIESPLSEEEQDTRETPGSDMSTEPKKDQPK